MIFQYGHTRNEIQIWGRHGCNLYSSKEEEGNIFDVDDVGSIAKGLCVRFTSAGCNMNVWDCPISVFDYTAFSIKTDSSVVKIKYQRFSTSWHTSSLIWERWSVQKSDIYTPDQVSKVQRKKCRNNNIYSCFPWFDAQNWHTPPFIVRTAISLRMTHFSKRDWIQHRVLVEAFLSWSVLLFCCSLFIRLWRED